MHTRTYGGSIPPSGVNFPAKNYVMVVRVRTSVPVRTEGVLRIFYVCRITFYLLFDRKNEPIRMRTLQKYDNANEFKAK